VTTNDLTERQRDILALVKQGQSATEIGRALGISSQGVHGHFQRLRSKGIEIPTQNGTHKASRRAPGDGGAPSGKALAAAQDAIKEHERRLLARVAEIDAEIRALQQERSETLGYVAHLRACDKPRTGDRPRYAAGVSMTSPPSDPPGHAAGPAPRN
jgi:biotin operon repressor